jgi:hypothetical protein
MDRRGTLHGWGLLATTGAGAVTVAVVGAFQSVTAGFTVVDLLGGILTTLVLLLLAQVIALRVQASSNGTKVGRALADIEKAQAELKDLVERMVSGESLSQRMADDVDRLVEDVSAMMVRLTDVVSIAKHNDEEITRLRLARHDYEKHVNNIIDAVRLEIIRLGGYKQGGKR